MTTDWIARRIQVAAGDHAVVLPGYCQGDFRSLLSKTGVPVERGPRDLRRLPEFFGQRKQPADYGAYDIEIIAEINHAPRLALAEILAEAARLQRAARTVIDVGCEPGEPWTGVADAVRALVDAGHRVSIDSLNPVEIAAGRASRRRAGAVRQLAPTARRPPIGAAKSSSCPTIPHTLAGLDETIDFLAAAGVPLRIDPMLEPIGFGFAASLGRYLDVRRRYPDAEMMMGIGNLTELTDVDSAADQRAAARLLPGAWHSQRADDAGHQLGPHQRWPNATWPGGWCITPSTHRMLPKHLEPRLVMLRDPQVVPRSDAELGTSGRADQGPQLSSVRPRRIAFTRSRQGCIWPTRSVLALRTAHGAGPARPIDASHAFYLGYEMAKAVTALTLGKEYRQDEALDWGFLTRAEQSHRLTRSTAQSPDRSQNVRRCPIVSVACRSSNRWARRLDVERVVSAASRAPTLFVSRQRPPRPNAGAVFVPDRRPVRLFRSRRRWQRRPGRTGAANRAVHSQHTPGLPPFQGGAAGSLATNWALAGKTAAAAIDEFQTPALAIGLYDVVMAIDHVQDQAWIISHGFPELDPQRRRAEPRSDLQQFRNWLSEPAAAPQRHDLLPPPLSVEQLAPQFAVPGPAGLTSNFSPRGLLASDRAGHRVHRRRRYLSGQPGSAAALSGA